MSTEDAKAMELTNKQTVQVEVNSDDRSLIFGDVIVRVSDDFVTAMHIDTDESNAVAPSGKLFGTIIK